MGWWNSSEGRAPWINGIAQWLEHYGIAQWLDHYGIAQWLEHYGIAQWVGVGHNGIEG